MTSNQNLQELVPEQLKPLYPLEEKLLEAAPLGREASDFELGEPIDMSQIGEAQTVRSELIIWLLTDPTVCEKVHCKGFNLKGAKIIGIFDFQDVTIQIPLRFTDCIIEGDLVLNRGKFYLLDFSGSQIKSISAVSIIVQYDVNLKQGFHSLGEVNFKRGEILGNFDCSGGEFENPEGNALIGDGLRIRGNLYLRRRFLSRGVISFWGARIDGRVDCCGGNFDNPGGDAFRGQSMSIRGSVLMRDGFKSKGTVRLHGAEIGYNLDCRDGEFENPTGIALNGDGIKIHRTAYFRDNYKSKGSVRLHGAEIGINLDCRGGEFENLGDYALFGEGLKARGSVFLCEGFKAKGTVRLLGAEIGGVLRCDDAEFENPNGSALVGDRLTTKGTVFLSDGFKAKGKVSFYGASIGGNLDCQEGIFDNNSGECFVGDTMKINGSLIWHDMKERPVGEVSLINAEVSNLLDDEGSWPQSDNLLVDGFIYGPFSSEMQADSKSRLKWLYLRPQDDSSVQPYEQLISVFQLMGLEDAAREIAIAKQRFIRKNLSGISLLWSRILDITISYGYRPEKVILLFILPIIVIGYFVFNWAYSIGVMEYVGNQAITNLTFNPFAYSLDVFLPIIDLNQQSSWSPITTANYGNYIQYFIYYTVK